MNKDRVQGAIDESVGSAKREAGEWAGDGQLQLEGIAQQVKGKLENAWGKAEDVVHEANEEAGIKHESRIEVEIECAAIEGEQGLEKIKQLAENP
jgi:uncharacterized protein YjbJ (UPF0337 family)